MNKDRYAYGYEVSLNIPTQSVPVITDTLNEKQYYSLKEVVELLNGYEMLCLMLININSELHDTRDSPACEALQSLLPGYSVLPSGSYCCWA